MYFFSRKSIFFFRGRGIFLKVGGGDNHNRRGRAFCKAFFHTMRFGYSNFAWSVHHFTFILH